MKTYGPRLLCVHQGGELYGSDRSFLQAVQALRQGWPDAHLKVVLAVDGPLKDRLAETADEVVTRDLCILRLANPVQTGIKSTVALPYYLAAAARDIADSDLAYINTTVVADYILAARFFPERSVVHVREIPKTRVAPLIRGLCRVSSAGLIYNSAATERAFAIPVSQRQAVIHNGVETVDGSTAPDLPAAFTPDRPLRVAMLGRISDWKGQDLLIDAVAAIPAPYRKCIRVRIVGSAFRDVIEPIRALEARIATAGLNDIVTLEPFRDDPEEVYRWADLCVVPSRLPEPFGRVAIEAMAYARPVIAAGHGGLVEIVEHGVNGWLFAPNNIEELATALNEAMTDPAKLSARASAAKERFTSHFSADTMAERLKATLRSWVPQLREA